HARRERHRRDLVQTHPMVDVDVVHAGRDLPDPDLARPRGGLRHVRPAHALGTTQLADDDGFRHAEALADSVAPRAGLAPHSPNKRRKRSAAAAALGAAARTGATRIVSSPATVPRTC